MVNEAHRAILEQGVEVWNQWRAANCNIMPDLREANLHGANLHRVNFYETRLQRANLVMATLGDADLHHANLLQANLRGADLRTADLRVANLHETDLRDANLQGANLRRAIFVETQLDGARLSSCDCYGISVWKVQGTPRDQENLTITPADEPVITVDKIEMAQFISLLLENKKIRDVIETVTSKAVLILGRFTPERKAILDALRETLRTRDRLPIVFDFTLPGSQTTDETVSTLAHMARFVIADLTDAKSILQELRAIVPNSPAVLVQPILLASQEEPGMFDFFRRFPWVLKPYRYQSQEELLAALDAQIIAPVETRRANPANVV